MGVYIILFILLVRERIFGEEFFFEDCGRESDVFYDTDKSMEENFTVLVFFKIPTRDVYFRIVEYALRS